MRPGAHPGAGIPDDASVGNGSVPRISARVSLASEVFAASLPVNNEIGTYSGQMT